jgi:mannose-6-phosphate isomerase-like protein (cupin superfamily)
MLPRAEEVIMPTEVAKPGYAVNVDDVEPVCGEGDTASTRVTIDASKGSELLTQRVVSFATGRSLPRSPGAGMQEILYVASGRGALHLDGPHELEPEMGVYVLPRDSYEVENPGPEDLVVVSVTTLFRRSNVGRGRRLAVRFADRPQIPVGGPREFRYLVNEDLGCLDVTQFVGLVQPSRAPEHRHEYDEVAYVVEGNGVIHMGELDEPVRGGTCIYFPRGRMHCLENSGPGLMRVMGVFYPSGSPAVHYTDDGEAG